MKFGVIVIVTALICAFAAHILLNDPGYVAINFRGYLVETNVPLLAALIAALFIAIWAIRKIIIAPRRIGEAAGRYRAQRAGQKLTRGMIAVAEGNFARGEKMLARAAGSSDSPLFNYLQAARAAHLQGLDERRDEWLRLAFQETPEAANAVLLTQAEFQLDRGHHEQALATLKRLEENTRNHGQAIALMGRLYFSLQDWDALRELLPRVRKYSQVKTETINDWTARVHIEALGKAVDGDAAIAAWKAVPKREKQQIQLQVAYYEALIRCGMHSKAEKDLASALKSDWRGPLVRLFGLVDGPDPSKQLKKAESWLKNHSEDPDLLLTAARLCLRTELWGKARSYLESVIAIRPTPEAYQEFGSLLSQLGEADAAADAFRDGLGLVASRSITALPHLADPEESTP